MMHLTTQFITENRGNYIFHWATGEQKNGILTVAVDVQTKFSRTLSELRAIEYLVFQKNVFQRDSILSGKGFHIHVSDDQICDIQDDLSCDAALIKQSFFLVSRLFGCKISLSDDYQRAFLANINKKTPNENIALAKTDFSCFETPAMGKVRVSKHAILQYQERLKTGNPQDPLKSIAKRIMHPNIKIQILPVDVRFKKKLVYGVSKTDEHWGHKDDDVHFVIVRDPKTNIGTLVTTYIRAPQFMTS